LLAHTVHPINNTKSAALYPSQCDKRQSVNKEKNDSSFLLKQNFFKLNVY